MKRLMLLLVMAGAICPGIVCAENNNGDKKDNGLADQAPPLMPHSGSSSSRANPDARVIQRQQVRDRMIKQDWPYVWEVDETKPITRIEVSLKEQKVRVFQGTVVAAEGPVSTGKPGRETPMGKQSVLGKEIDHKSSLYGNFVNSKGHIVDPNAEAGQAVPPGLHYEPSPMPFFLRLTDTGVGMHEGFLPGYAASHGCIRMPRALAQKMFNAVPVGTPVEILP